MGRLNRRAFLRGSAGLGALGGAAALQARGGAVASNQNGRRALHGGAHAAHTGAVGRVDHARNGFDPHTILTDFDYGEVSRDRSGRRVREYELVAIDKEIEVAPGVFFPAWTYNGRVPGPSLRATDGDRMRVTLVNASAHPHTIHFHGFHPSGMDGIPGAGEPMPGEKFTYDFIAGPFGTHLYHCHSLPLVQHIHRGLYGAFIVDPKGGRPDANEMVMVMNAFDTNFDGGNEVYAVNTIAFAYMATPIEIRRRELQRVYLINVTEFDPINSFHLHANFFNLYRTGTSLEPDEFTDTISMGQAERHMLEFSYPDKGDFLFHAHVTEFVDLGWISSFRVL